MPLRDAPPYTPHAPRPPRCPALRFWLIVALIDAHPPRAPFPDCYSRYTAQLADVELMMQKIVDTCILARVVFRDTEEVRRLWRYLNLLQVAAYTGLSASYNEANFFTPVCKRHDLWPKREAQKATEAGALEAIRNGDGAAAFNNYQIWALELVQHEAMASNTRLTAPVHTQLNQQILEVGCAGKRLHAYTYQVLPFICESSELAYARLASPSPVGTLSVLLAPPAGVS